MSHKAIAVLVVLIWLSVSACSQRGKIPRSELKEIRQLAFAGASKRYALSDALIESRYQPRKDYPRKREQSKGTDQPFSESDYFPEQYERRVPAVASVKGVELSPATSSVCLIKFDFEPSPNPHAELPEDQATAERFEKPDGSHYWSIGWK